jgi:hypothetical protein
VEKEQRAFSIFSLVTIFNIILMYIILYIPEIQIIQLGYFIGIGFTGILFLIPRRPNKAALNGIRGYVVGATSRPDERDTITNRYRLEEGTPNYKEYYSRHPELEDIDARAPHLAYLVT